MLLARRHIIKLRSNFGLIHSSQFWNEIGAGGSHPETGYLVMHRKRKSKESKESKSDLSGSTRKEQWHKVKCAIGRVSRVKSRSPPPQVVTARKRGEQLP
ncbi:hypothetical protein RUM43_004980 [Polyplax serrata]|uniref:Uncharacterized protein n=1 Tax=Polyplax serrata TaxID=468196 RepID=A0AAN8SEQ8_POLSC